ncbi:hypothetical protein FHY02_003288 [Sphingomonas sp. BK069]|nr:hypothetical protein [Sphingomonas sp. BK069]
MTKHVQIAGIVAMTLLAAAILYLIGDTFHSALAK